jgi:hypothetical protein
MTAERDLGIPAQGVPALPEQDTWAYHTWKGTAGGGRARAVGRSMVCCVFVCGCVVCDAMNACECAYIYGGQEGALVAERSMACVYIAYL